MHEVPCPLTAAATYAFTRPRQKPYSGKPHLRPGWEALSNERPYRDLAFCCDALGPLLADIVAKRILVLIGRKPSIAGCNDASRAMRPARDAPREATRELDDARFGTGTME